MFNIYEKVLLTVTLAKMGHREVTHNVQVQEEEL